MDHRYDRIARRRFITKDDIHALHERSDTCLVVEERSTVTDEARELALKLGIRLEAPRREGRPAPAAALDAGSAAPPSTPAAARASAATSTTAAPSPSPAAVADAIAAVLSELGLASRAGSLAPEVTRRVTDRLADGRT